jgi:hypothetical protein
MEFSLPTALSMALVAEARRCKSPMAGLANIPGTAVKRFPLNGSKPTPPFREHKTSLSVLSISAPQPLGPRKPNPSLVYPPVTYMITSFIALKDLTEHLGCGGSLINNPLRGKTHPFN